MREFLCKAKRIDNEEWVEGVPIFDYRDQQWRIIMELDYSTGTCITSDHAPRVIAKTICRYTGRADKYGKKIWENDIIEVKNKKRHFISQIEWDNCSCGFMFQDTETTFCGMDALSDVGCYRLDYEIIGNIFDNADLFKE